jgi:hypothetical protein
MGPEGWGLRAQPEESCAPPAGCAAIWLRNWIEPPMPRTWAARRDHARRGRPRIADLRDVLNAIQYIAATDCRRSLLRRGSPPSRPCSGVSTTGAMAAFCAPSPI